MPTPPGPCTVTNRYRSNSATMLAMSSSRPISSDESDTTPTALECQSPAAESSSRSADTVATPGSLVPVSNSALSLSASGPGSTPSSRESARLSRAKTDNASEFRPSPASARISATCADSSSRSAAHSFSAISRAPEKSRRASNTDISLRSMSARTAAAFARSSPATSPIPVPPRSSPGIPRHQMAAASRSDGSADLASSATMSRSVRHRTSR